MRAPVFPQRPTSANAEVLSVEWLFEPFWPGDRLIARAWRGTVEITDDLGQPPGGEQEAEIAELLAAAVMSDDATVDGVWTPQPFLGDGSPARAWAETIEEEGLAEQVPDPLSTVRRRAFVAVDLLEVDGQPLYDIPFQERRRQLESVVDESVQVRISPLVKLPVAGWLNAWRTNGFTHYVAKHQNSRYLPGERNDDWLKLSTRAEPPKGMVGRLVSFGGGERIRRIRD